MTTPPVSLGELRQHINTPAANQADDEEMWRKLLAATRMVEWRCGVMEPQWFTSRVGAEGFELRLPRWPVMSVESVNTLTDGFTVSSGGTVWLSTYQYVPGVATVVYKAGRDPVPDDLMEATLVIAAQLWESQRGPAGTAPVTFAGVGGGGTQAMPRGFALPNRALELMAPYTFTAFAS